MELFNLKTYAIAKEIPIITDEALNFIVEIINRNHFKELLEIGSAIGYSANAFARKSEIVQIISLEKDYHRFLEAKRHPHSKIEFLWIDAYDYQPDRTFDVIFLDAAKSQYFGLFKKYIEYLNKNGVLIVDNMMFHGFVKLYPHISNRNTKQLVGKLIKFKTYLKDHPEYKVTYYDEIGDGIAVIRR